MREIVQLEIARVIADKAFGSCVVRCSQRIWTNASSKKVQMIEMPKGKVKNCLHFEY